jgi:carnitine O-acetyltransferase
VLCLSLDHYAHALQKSLPLNGQVELDSHLHNIRSGQNARNRWFDKAFTLVVEANTRAGVMGEHSPCDALVPSIAADYAVVQSVEEDAFATSASSDERPDNTSRVGWKRLDWVIDELIESECLKAEERAKAVIDNSDDSLLWFTEYGTDWIKGVGLYPPASEFLCAYFH